MVAATLERPDAHAPVRVEAGARLSIEAVSHAFAVRGTPLPVLDRVSLDVAPGGFVALLGPSGCGKSTLLRLVAGLEPPDRGLIAVDGRPVDGPDPSRLLVFQDPTLYPWRTVRGNVVLGLEARGLGRERAAKADAALRLVGLDGFAEVYPHQLSGGMAQRAALARALVNEPRLLLLDEPLGRLDALTRLTMQAEILRLWREARFTAVLVTHDVEEALVLAERVVVLGDRPAAIRAELSVDAPYPRHRDDPRIVQLRREILDILGQTTWKRLGCDVETDHGLHVPAGSRGAVVVVYDAGGAYEYEFARPGVGNATLPPEALAAIWGACRTRLTDAPRPPCRIAGSAAYLLGVEHGEGGPKAVFFRSRGITVDDPRPFIMALRDHGRPELFVREVVGTRVTKLVHEEPMPMPDGSAPQVRIVWKLVEDDPTKALVTAYAI